MPLSLHASNTEPDSDAALVRRYLANEDERAAEELIRRHARSVYRTLCHLLGNIEDSEDLTQQVFVKAFAALSTYTDRGQFRSWLLRIARNESFALMRRRKVRPQFEREVREGDLDAPSVIEEIQSRDRVAGIAQAILQLPAEERQVVQLRLQEELGFREIAELLEVPLGTVLSRMHQARDRLRRALKSEIQSTPVI